MAKNKAAKRKKKFMQTKICESGCTCALTKVDTKVDEETDEDTTDSPELADSDDEEDIPDIPKHLLSAKQRKRRETRVEEEKREAERNKILQELSEEVEKADSMTISELLTSIKSQVWSKQTGPTGSDLDLPPVTDEAGSCAEPRIDDAEGHASEPKPISDEALEDAIGPACPMELRYPQGVNAASKPAWQRMPFAMLVDSGAADTVMPNSWFTDYKLEEGDGSKRVDATSITWRPTAPRLTTRVRERWPCWPWIRSSGK